MEPHSQSYRLLPPLEMVDNNENDAEWGKKAEPDNNKDP